jgi:protein-disulfide isomerase
MMISKQLNPPTNQADHSQGTADAAIEIVEYGDFECPDCGDAYRTVKKIEQVFGNQIRFVFRNFPLTDIHPYAMAAAMAAEAAGLQHKYWEMHDLIFKNQDQLSEDLFVELANNMGLDSGKFKHDLQDKALHERILSDFDSGVQNGVNGTPTFFVNGQKFDGGADDLFNMLRENAD